MIFWGGMIWFFLISLMLERSHNYTIKEPYLASAWNCCHNQIIHVWVKQTSAWAGIKACSKFTDNQFKYRLSCHYGQKKIYNQSMMMIIYARPYIPCPPSLLCALCYPATMYNPRGTQRDFTGPTISDGGQEDQAIEWLRGYTPGQQRSASSGVSGTCESDAHGSDMFSLGSTGGGGAYNQEYSTSLRHVSIGCIAATAHKITHLCSQVALK